MTAIKRLIQREGQDATITEYSSSGENRFGNPTDRTETTTDTKALVDLKGPDHSITVQGERVAVDAEILIPKDVDLTVPQKGDGEEYPVIEVGPRGGTREKFRIHKRSIHGVLDGGALLFCQSQN